MYVISISGMENILEICSLNSKITPASPISIPVIIDLLLKFSAHLGLSSNTNHSGADDTVIATIALGMLCSTQIIIPFPKKSSKIPLIIACLIPRMANKFSPFMRHHAAIINPAKMNRNAPKMNGGKP